MSEGTEGFWAWPGNARKAHYFVGVKSVCDKWMFFGEQPDQPQHIGEEPGKDDCVPCWRKVREAGDD